jgi:hypothetical protein
VLARALGRNGLGRVHVSRRSGRGSGASVSWRVLHETKNRFFLRVWDDIGCGIKYKAKIVIVMLRDAVRCDAVYKAA